MPHDLRQEEVFAKLSLVYDPELDQPLTELGFISRVRVNAGLVEVQFRLPTYWCAPNFAFMMASDIYDRVTELPWVSRVIVQLEDHCASEQINNGLRDGKSFSATFPEYAAGELDDLRNTFRAKAFLSRLDLALRDLLSDGLHPDACIEMTINDLRSHRLASTTGSILRYLTIRQELTCQSEKAFVRFTGEPISVGEFAAYLREARRTRISTEFNVSQCRGLLNTRYGDDFQLVQIKG